MAKETADDFFAISNFARVEKTDFCAVPTEWPTNHLIFGLHECQMQKKNESIFITKSFNSNVPMP